MLESRAAVKALKYSLPLGQSLSRGHFPWGPSCEGKPFTRGAQKKMRNGQALTMTQTEHPDPQQGPGVTGLASTAALQHQAL